MDKLKAIRTASKNASAYFRENGIPVDISPADIEEIKSNPPPKKIDFPLILFIVTACFEIFDIAVLFLVETVVLGMFWRVIRTCSTGYMYLWAIKTIQGSVSAVSLKRKMLEKALRRIILVFICNLPIPVINDILGVIPVDMVFILLTYNYNSKIVQLLWAVIEGDFKKLNISVGVSTNITRTRRGPELQITQRSAGDKTQDGTKSKQSASVSGLSKKDDNLDLRNVA